MRTKYGNKKTAGYDSKREAARAKELKFLCLAGEISDLREQVAFDLIPRQLGSDGKVAERAVKYIADFVYLRAGVQVVEDCKGFRTPDYIIKRKLMRHVHKIAIMET